MKFRPLHDRVLVKKAAPEAKSAGGIIIPDSAAEKPQQGEVLAVGPGAALEDGSIRPTSLKVGDKVLFTTYAGTQIKLEGEEQMILKESEILAVIE